MDHKEEILKHLIIAPLDIRISVDKDFVSLVKGRLVKFKKPVRLGDLFTVPMLGHVIPFIITSANPSEGVFNHDTKLDIMSEPPEKEREIVRMKLKAGDKYPLIKTDLIVRSEEVEENGESHLILWVSRVMNPEKYKIIKFKL